MAVERFSATRNTTVRRLTCAYCGAEFLCDLSGGCWCADEAFVMAMPKDGGDCLCRDCLQAKAAALRLLSP